MTIFSSNNLAHGREKPFIRIFPLGPSTPISLSWRKTARGRLSLARKTASLEAGNVHHIFYDIGRIQYDACFRRGHDDLERFKIFPALAISAHFGIAENLAMLQHRPSSGKLIVTLTADNQIHPLARKNTLCLIHQFRYDIL